MTKVLGLAAAVVSGWCATTIAADQSRAAFEKYVAGVLIRRCLECHNASDVKGGLDLTQRSTLLKGGESGPALVAGDADKSLLIERIADRSMPPGKRRKLSQDEIAALRTWVKRGAVWPAGRRLDPFELSSERRAGLDWWSLQPVRRPQLPAVPDAAWIRNPIDAFILAKLEANRLTPSAAADRRTLIRRLHLILTGLPPKPADVERFVGDPRPDAYERLVERLLSSPRYGERWARHWLDIARFAETNGFETNTPRPNAWRYRDYVIDAFNADEPYDRFVKEQLAGDALGADAATGFLVAGPYDTVKSPDVNLTLMQRNDELHDIINATSTAFLGLTVACARCHNHKFDPIVQTDYYAFQAVFAGVKHGDRPLEAGPDGDRERRLAAARRRLNELRNDLARIGLAEPVNARLNRERFEPVTAKFVRFTVLATNASEPCLDELEVLTAGENPRNVALAAAGAKATSSGDYRGNPKHRLEHVNDGQYGNPRSWISNQNGAGWVQIEFSEPAVIDRINWGRDRNQRFKDRLATRYRIDVASEPNKWLAVASSDGRLPFGTQLADVTPSQFPRLTADALAKAKRLIGHVNELQATIASLSRLPLAYAGSFEQPGPTHRLHRGDPLAKREVVVPAAIASLKRPLKLTSRTAERDRRIALANWIADPANPLTARVLVNRIWQHHFGRGLVATPSDFGRMGVPPSHRELLDWLAAEFIASGYSVKRIQRLIVSSHAWRQSSRPRTAAMKLHAGNKLLWRFSPRRLEAEAVRDSVLFVAGTLQTTMGGPGFSVFKPNTNYVRVYEPQEQWGPAQWRRMIYTTKVRMEHDAVFGALDCPDAGQVTARRPRSTTPLQALNLLNSSFMLQQADIMAADIAHRAGDDVAAQARLAFRRAFGREAIEAEVRASLKLVESHGVRALCRALLNANEFLFVQ